MRNQLILIALLALGGRYAYQHWAQPVDLPDREQAKACFYQDTGAYDCLSKLYGIERIRKCSWYLEWDSVSGSIDKAFTRCIASAYPAKPSIWRQGFGTYQEE